ncbi:hypothetical protein BTO01_18360 [Vibrio jasicida]|nr:hypothetical protein BTO01_18360 [Vibrio jasicida]
MFPSNKGKLFFLWCLLLSCFGFASSAQATLSIQEAVDLWILDGAEFHQMVKCSPQAQLNNGVQQIYYDSSSCVLSELATYALAKECFGESNANRVDMIDVNTKLNSITFDVTPSTCSLLEKKSTKAPKKRPTEKKLRSVNASSKVYVIQLYSGETSPNKEFARCAKLPLFEHHINGSYYLFSDVYSGYSEAKSSMAYLQTQCPALSMWIRPIKR